jgi:hypothetical protein
MRKRTGGRSGGYSGVLGRMGRRKGGREDRGVV